MQTLHEGPLAKGEELPGLMDSLYAGTNQEGCISSELLQALENCLVSAAFDALLWQRMRSFCLFHCKSRSNLC